MTLEEIITTRRSVRSFADKPVSREAILKLLDLARWAPYQPVEELVVLQSTLTPPTEAR